MRVLSYSADGEAHSHSHSHGKDSTTGKSTSIDGHTGELRKRKGQKSTSNASPDGDEKVKPVNASLKLSAYLNLFGDFTHNITDGLAMAASFYSSPALGAVTTIATFCHEIPHEIADYSILIKSGFTKYQAFGAQLFTALGAFCGTFLGIWIASNSGSGAATLKPGQGVLGTSVSGSDLVIPLTAGGQLARLRSAAEADTTRRIPLHCQCQRGA